jgi:hypothetical protein
MDEESIVLYRLSDYERRGWISQIDSAQFRSVMNQRRADHLVVRQIAARLDALALRDGGGGGDGEEEANEEEPATVSSTYTSSSSGVASPTSTDPTVGSEEETDASAEANRNESETNFDDDDAANNVGNPAMAANGSASSYLRSLQCISNTTNGILLNAIELNGNKKEAIRSKNQSQGGSNNSSHHHVTWEDDADRKGPKEAADIAKSANVDRTPRSGNDEEREDDEMSIMEPNELWRTRSSTLTLAALQDLFVEMCFYARLGFVQPPCCLQCTYRYAHDGNLDAASQNNGPGSPDGGGQCRRYVVWRKNATSLLHPSNLGSNMVLVPCASARLLMDGQVVSGYFWDAAKKRLRSTPDERAKAAAESSKTAASWKTK